MSGTDIIGALMRADAGVLDIAPIERIKGGRLPDKVDLPAFLIRETSTVERQALKRGATTRTVDRVSVTVVATSYDDLRRGIQAVRDCCGGRTGNIGGGLRVSVLSAGAGPELDGPGGRFERTQDYRVSYDA